MGWWRACQVRTLAGVGPDPPGVKEAATGRYCLWRWHWGTPTPLLPTLVGHENASVRAGGRRQRRRQTPRGHDGDRVKVCQAWCPEPTGQTRTWGMFTKGSRGAPRALRALAGALHRRAVSNYQAGKRSALKDARSV